MSERSAWVVVDHSFGRRDWKNVPDSEKGAYAARRDGGWWVDLGQRMVKVGKDWPAKRTVGGPGKIRHGKLRLSR